MMWNVVTFNKFLYNQFIVFFELRLRQTAETSGKNVHFVPTVIREYIYIKDQQKQIQQYVLKLPLDVNVNNDNVV